MLYVRLNGCPLFVLLVPVLCVPIYSCPDFVLLVTLVRAFQQLSCSCVTCPCVVRLSSCTVFVLLVTVLYAPFNNCPVFFCFTRPFVVRAFKQFTCFCFTDPCVVLPLNTWHVLLLVPV